MNSTVKLPGITFWVNHFLVTCLWEMYVENGGNNNSTCIIGLVRSLSEYIYFSSQVLNTCLYYQNYMYRHLKN